MRAKCRLAVSFGLAVLLVGAGRSVLAQAPPGMMQGPPGMMQAQPGMVQMTPGGPAPGYGGPPNFSGQVAPPTSYNGSMASPEYSGYPSVIPPVPPPMPPGTYGSTINPYPQISPYDYTYQHDSHV